MIKKLGEINEKWQINCEISGIIYDIIDFVKEYKTAQEEIIMKKMVKKLIITSLLAMSVMGVMPVAASAEWKQDSEKNYYWMENGVKAQGWKFINGNWYDFRNDGVMQVSWVQDNGNWYYLWSGGDMAHDAWLQNSGSWYYFESDGKMAYNKTIIGSREYSFSQPTYIISNDLNGKTTTSSAVKVK